MSNTRVPRPHHQPPQKRLLIPAPPWSRRASGLTALGVTLATLVAGTVPALAKGSPDLVVTEARLATTTVSEGGTIVVSHKVKNVGTSAAGPSTTRFYLTRDVARSLAERKASRTAPRSSPYDIRLIGGREIARVSKGGSRDGRSVEVTVPIGTAAGRYSVLACTDDLAAVKEGKEANNCTITTGTLEVTPPEGADTLELGSFSDTSVWPEDEELSLELIKMYCDSTEPARQLTLSEALQGTRRFLVKEVGAESFEQLEASGQADTAEKAQELAAAGALQGAPGLALAALLEAHRLEPRNGGHLVNAAAVATTIGLPNEAIAFLDAAQPLDFRRPAMGIAQQSIAMVTRGHALLLTGRYPDARKMFLATKAAEPMLSEADAGLATVEACTGHEELAARYIRRSRQRSDEQQPPVPTKDPERPAPWIDVEHGMKTPLRQAPTPPSTSQAVALEGLFVGMVAKASDQIMQLNDEEQAIWERFRDGDVNRTWAEVERRDSILALVHEALFESDIEQLDTKFFDALQVLEEHEDEFLGSGDVPGRGADILHEAWETCSTADDWQACVDAEMASNCAPVLNSHHSAWLGKMDDVQAAANEYMAAASDRMSAYAANLKDEDAHRKAMISIETVERSTYYLLMSTVSSWTTRVASWEQWNCVNPEQPRPVTDPEAPDALSVNSCTDDIKKHTAVGSFGPLTFKVNCEETTIGIAGDVLPLLQAFGELSIKGREGKITVIAGVQSEADLGVVKGGFKSGLYLQSDLDGELTDVGWRVGPSMTAGRGPYEYEVFKDELDLSFLPDTTQKM